MSAIFGIINRNGEPVRAEELALMRDVSTAWGPDSGSTWVQGAAALGCCLRHVTPEDVNESLPRADDKEGLAFTAQGRLDNRVELFHALGVPSLDRVGFPDGELMRRAYSAWGNGAPDRLSASSSSGISSTLRAARGSWRKSRRYRARRGGSSSATRNQF